MISKTLYDYLGTDKIMKSVFDWLREIDSGLLDVVPVVTVSDNGVKYNVATTDPSGSWIDVDDEIPEDTGTFTQRSAALYRFINDANVDKMRMDMSGTQNVAATEIKRVTAAMMRNLYAAMLWGQTTTSSGTKQPKGLVLLTAELQSEATVTLDGAGVNNTQVVANHATSGALTLAKIEEMMDQVKRGCNGLIMSRQTRRKVNALSNAAGTPVQQDKDSYGRNIEVYQGAKIYIMDAMDNNIPDSAASILTIASHDRSATWASGADNTIILGTHFAPDGVCMIQTPNGKFQKEAPFTHPKKDAYVHRFKWYGGFACFDKFSLAALTGIATDAAS